MKTLRIRPLKFFNPIYFDNTRIMNTQTIAEQDRNRASRLKSLVPVMKDPVFITMLVIMTILVLVDSVQFKTSVIKTLNSLWEMLPFFRTCHRHSRLC